MTVKILLSMVLSATFILNLIWIEFGSMSSQAKDSSSKYQIDDKYGEDDYLNEIEKWLNEYYRIIDCVNAELKTDGGIEYKCVSTVYHDVRCNYDSRKIEVRKNFLTFIDDKEHLDQFPKIQWKQDEWKIYNDNYELLYPNYGGSPLHGRFYFYNLNCDSFDVEDEIGANYEDNVLNKLEKWLDEMYYVEACKKEHGAKWYSSCIPVIYFEVRCDYEYGNIEFRLNQLVTNNHDIEWINGIWQVYNDNLIDVFLPELIDWRPHHGEYLSSWDKPQFCDGSPKGKIFE